MSFSYIMSFLTHLVVNIVEHVCQEERNIRLITLKSIQFGQYRSHTHTNEKMSSLSLSERISLTHPTNTFKLINIVGPDWFLLCKLRTRLFYYKFIIIVITPNKTSNV